MISIVEQAPVIEKNRTQKNFAVAVATGATLATVATAPAHAQVAVTELDNTITAISGLTSALVPVIIGAMAYRLGIKIVNRISVKG